MGLLALLLLCAGGAWAGGIPSGTKFVMRIHVVKGHNINIDFKGTGKAYMAKGSYSEIEKESLKLNKWQHDSDGHTDLGDGGYIDIYGNNITAIRIYDNKPGDRDIHGVNFSYIDRGLKEIYILSVKGNQNFSADAFDAMFASLPPRSSSDNCRFYIEKEWNSYTYYFKRCRP